MAFRLGLGTLLVALAVWAMVCACAPAPAQQPEIAPLPRPNAPTHQWLGTGSCASAACHNANGLKGEPRSEYTTWLSHDRHARAYDVLFNAKSRTIVKNLRLEGGLPAHQLPLCLNCHVHEGFAAANHHRHFAREDGVSCESCHGPAGGWLGEHYKPSWSRLSAAEKNARGMKDTRSLASRVQSCTPCHVGQAGMEVNHDLIAAGHPRLAFDFSAYHAIMPRHWPDDKERIRPDWDAVAWFVGEAVTAEAALKLLAARASSPIWPEFAENDCYACHHQLQNQNWRQQREPGLRKAGSLAWNDWYSSAWPFKLELAKVDAGKLFERMAQLKKTMESQVSPDRELVRMQADQAARSLADWVKRFDSSRIDSRDMAAILQQIAERGATQKARSWDDATKTYLAAVAMHHAWRGVRNAHAAPPDVQEAFKKIRGLLQFTPQTDSPSPGYTPDQLFDPYQLLRKHLF